MPPVPLPLSLDPLLGLLDWVGVGVFALSGALVAAARRRPSSPSSSSRWSPASAAERCAIS
jgi:hypothetical protein